MSLLQYTPLSELEQVCVLSTNTAVELHNRSCPDSQFSAEWFQLWTTETYRLPQVPVAPTRVPRQRQRSPYRRSPCLRPWPSPPRELFVSNY